MATCLKKKVPSSAAKPAMPTWCCNPPMLVVSDRLTIRIHTQFTGHPSETHEVRIA
jgi:hypothetical protein